MKKIILCKIIIGLIILASCSNNDDSDLKSDSIIGNWIVTESKFGENDINSQDIVIFDSDNRVEFTYERPDGDLILVGNWTKTNNTINIKWDDLPDFPAIYEILELTNSTMKWKSDDIQETLKR